MGSNRETNPFLPEDAFDEVPEAAEILSGEADLTPSQTLQVMSILRSYYANVGGYNSALCGGRGCIRACMVHLEERGVLSNQCETPFRRRKPWRLSTRGD